MSESKTKKQGICKNCGEPIELRGKEWRHLPTGFWICHHQHAEPKA